MAVNHAPESAVGKELWRWDHTVAEVNPYDPTIRGMRPVGFQPYPSRMYRVVERNPLSLEGATAHSEQERRNLESRGFVVGGQDAAVEAYDKALGVLAKAAAERNYTDRRMSEAAQAEAARVESEIDGHVPEIPAQPLKRRGRPKKTDVPA